MNSNRDDALARWFERQPQPNAAEDFTGQLAPRLQREKARRYWRRALAAIAALCAVALLEPAIERVTLLAADAVLQVTEISLSAGQAR